MRDKAGKSFYYRPTQNEVPYLQHHLLAAEVSDDHGTARVPEVRP